MYDLAEDQFFTDRPLETQAARVARILAANSAPDDGTEGRRFCFGHEHVIKFMSPPPPLEWND